MKKLALIALLPLAVSMGGCIKFGAKPPASLLALQPATAIPVGPVENSATAPTITIAEPTVPQELSVTRVPVRATDTSVAYVKDAEWVDTPSRLFARLLSDTFAAKSDYVVLPNRLSTFDPKVQLTGELRDFGVDAATQEAVVTYDAVMLREGASGVVTRRFQARVPVGAIEASAVGVALNTAANQVADQVVGWIAG